MLFCKNERAVIPLELQRGGVVVTVVAVAAILVGGIRLHFADVVPNREHPGPSGIPCRAALHKGQEMGGFEHGSTLIVFAPKGVVLCDWARPGAVIRTGNALMRLP